MARATGVTCDVCGAFVAVTKDKGLPFGWLALRVVTDNERTEGDNNLEMCSNKCLKRLATERVRGERELAGGRPAAAPKTKTYTPEGRESMRRNGMSTAHKKGFHDSSPNPECPMCEAASAP